MDSFDSERDGAVDGLTLTVAIAVGVAIGVFVGGLALWYVQNRFTAIALQDVALQSQRAVTEQASAVREAQQRSVDLNAVIEASRVRDLAASQRADAAAQTEAIARAERREQAWRKFYRPSPGCGGAAASVECSNEFIRAKRAFDEKFARGEL